MHEVLWGGDLQSGKTSNVELDKICSYLRDRCLPCDTARHLSEGRIKRMEQMTLEKGVLYFPIFVRHHWIAGILRSEGGGHFTLTTMDSAPSPCVYADLRRVFGRLWPALTLIRGHSARQRRDSEDCGIYMVANLFAHHFGVAIGDPDTIPQRLRPFLFDATVTKPKRYAFLTALKQKLLHKPANGTPQTSEANVCQGGSAPVQAALHDPSAHAPAAARRNLCYMLVASAIANRADGKHRTLTVGALAMRATRLQFPAGEHQDVAEALTKLGVRVLLYGERTPGGRPTLLEHANPKRKELVVQTTKAGLPRVLVARQFVLGARFTGKVSTDGAFSGHYTLTRSPSEAVVGLYLPPEDITPADSFPISEQDTQPALRPGKKPQHTAASLLEVSAQPCLNVRGRRIRGYTCPRGWFIHPDRPPFTSPVGWEEKTKEVRKQHLRWLRELRAMPADLLAFDLPQAAIELVRRMALARKWRWSTISRTLQMIHGALINLPLYTNELEGIDLSTSPEWRAACSAARRFEREEEPSPPPPATQEEVVQAYKHLASTPEAAVYLSMLWSFAARAGDIGSLHGRDVTIGQDRGDGTVGVALTMKRGKGARFRGPYPLASTLRRQDAAVLHKLVAARKPDERVFANLDGIRTYVRTALKRVNPHLTISSIRKGAARHLAQKKVPEEEIQRLTGHSRMDTLRRYLGYGLHLTKEAVMAQDSVGRALLEPSGSE